MPLDRQERFNLMLCENKTKIYYISSSGKFGYVWKHELKENNNRMNEQLIKWAIPKTVIRNHKQVLRVCVDGQSRTLKKLVAKFYIRGYNNDLHYVANIDGNYKNCSVSNLKLIVKKTIQAKLIIAMKQKEVRCKKENDSDYLIFPSIRHCANYLHVYHRTLANYLHGKCKESCLDGYTFIFNGNKIEKKGENNR